MTLSHSLTQKLAAKLRQIPQTASKAPAAILMWGLADAQGMAATSACAVAGDRVNSCRRGQGQQLPHPAELQSAAHMQRQQ